MRKRKERKSWPKGIAFSIKGKPYQENSPHRFEALISLSSIDTVTLTREERILSKQFSKRKAFLFAFVLTAVAFLTSFGLESENPVFLIDDYAKTILPLIALGVIIATWKKDDAGNLRRTNNLGTVIGALIIVFSALAIAIESSNSEALADDFPGIILGVFLLINGLL